MTATRAPELMDQLQAGNPAEQLAEELIRLRRKGFTFELAWKRAIRSITWPTATETRRQWKAVVEGGKGYWRAMYETAGVRLTLMEIVEGMSLGLDLHDESESLRS